jgi:hypothetical protein
VTAVGKTWQAALVSSVRGALLTRRAQTKADAYAQAHRLLDDAEDRAWFHGEVVRIEIAQEG